MTSLQGEPGRRRPAPAPAVGRVELGGEAILLGRLGPPIERALGARPAFYRVQIESVGRCGEVLVCVTTSKGRLPLLFAGEELEPGFVVSVVTSSLDRFRL